MPGVPSGRGCDACRKQKKRCDQSQPTCSRCRRLQIACVGCGQQRYTFKNQSTVLMPTGFRAAQTTACCVPSAPSNEMTMATSAFLSVLEVTDVRFDLSIYGNFLKDVPRRLGANEALDASVCALATAFSSVHSHQQSAVTFNKYAMALKSLQVCLSDPAQAESPNTLCAIYLVMICQGWIGKPNDNYTSHGEAMSHLLSVAVSQNWKGGFETEMLVTVSVLLILESFINPRIDIEPWLRKLPETFGPCSPANQESAIESLRSRNLAKVPPLLKEPHLHLLEIQFTYRQVCADCAKMSRVLSQSSKASLSGVSETPLSLGVRKLQVRYQTGYCILLCIAIMLNAILYVYDPLNYSLVEESTALVDEIITLAAEASQYRPLGSSAMPLCLVAALAATDAMVKRSRVEELLAEYQSDFASARWLELAVCFRTKMKNPRLDIIALYHEHCTEIC